jgi:hypothetical protein
MRALSSYLASIFQRLKAKWAAARAKRRERRRKGPQA